jgi:hypothetical protein
MGALDCTILRFPQYGSDVAGPPGVYDRRGKQRAGVFAGQDGIPSGRCDPRRSRGVIWAAITRHGIVSPRRNSPSRGVAPTTTPNQRPRISQPSRWTSSPVSSSRHNCHRSSRCTTPARAARWGRAPASRRAAIRTSAGVRTLTPTAWAWATLADHRDGATGQPETICTTSGFTGHDRSPDIDGLNDGTWLQPRPRHWPGSTAAPACPRDHPPQQIVEEHGRSPSRDAQIVRPSTTPLADQLPASHSELKCEPVRGSRNPGCLNHQLREPPKASGVPHKNPTSPPPGPPPQTSHGHGGIPRHTPALLLKWG